jgi:DNA-binding MarR family transcriptional regulator
MEKKGLIRRVQNKKDRRKWHVHLTPKGQALKRDLIPLAREVVDTAVQSLSRKEVKQLLEALAEVQKNLNATVTQLDEVSSKAAEKSVE